MIRVSSDYNGTCFKTGDTSWYDSDDSEQYKFVLQWTCAKYADCDAMGIDFLDGMWLCLIILLYYCHNYIRFAC